MQLGRYPGTGVPRLDPGTQIGRETRRLTSNLEKWIRLEMVVEKEDVGFQSRKCWVIHSIFIGRV